MKDDRPFAPLAPKPSLFNNLPIMSQRRMMQLSTGDSLKTLTKRQGHSQREGFREEATYCVELNTQMFNQRKELMAHYYKNVSTWLCTFFYALVMALLLG
jgi:hypothetical protein